MPQGWTARYAGALAVLFGIAALTAACGSQPAGLVGAPTSASTAAGAVTAPATATADSPAPVFSPAPAPGASEAPLAIAAVPRATTAVATTPATPSTTRTPTAAPAPSPAPAGPSSTLSIVSAPIRYPASRLQEMAAYSLRHYGTASSQLAPTVIVLHFTDGGSAAGARATFAADVANMGELPGTCAHYLVDKDGTVYQLVPPTIRCRHTIGLNDSAIGIEMVQEGGPGASWADQQILNRPAQIGSALALVRDLQARFGIATSNVIGHATANAAPQFHDLLGWRNDHQDWQAADVAQFRARL